MHFLTLDLLDEDLHISAVDYMNGCAQCGLSFMCGSVNATSVSLCSAYSQRAPQLGCSKLLTGAHYWHLTLLGSERLALISSFYSSTNAVYCTVCSVACTRTSEASRNLIEILRHRWQRCSVETRQRCVRASCQVELGPPGGIVPSCRSHWDSRIFIHNE